MIEIANWVANMFILGLGTLFLGLGGLILLIVLFKFSDRNGY